MEEVLPKRIKTVHDRHLEYETHEKEDPAPLLMRLFKSDHFSPYIAVQYLFSEKDSDIRIYLGSKLFGFRTEDLDFYLPQLINMYITDKHVVEALRPYLEARCKEDVYFAALSLWMLESFGINRPLSPDKNRVHGQLLQLEIEGNFKSHGPVCHCMKHRRIEECRCDSNRLSVEREFISLLMSIGNKLTEEPTKKEKTRRLVTELMRLNMSLPARISIPFSNDHVVLRIPPTNSCVLNSKDKAPYCMYVEVLRCPNIDKVDLPQNLNDAHNELVLRIRSSSTASLDENTSYSAPDESLTTEKEEAIEVVECQEDLDSSEKFGDMCPDPAWDTMTMESANSEPVLHHGRMPLQPKEFGRRLKSAAKWVNSKRPRRKLTQMRPHPDDPSASTMSEPWEEKRERIRQGSPYGRLPNWDLIPVIVKSGDDLAQELLAHQLLKTLKAVWEEENVSLYLRPYKIVVTSPSSGLIEPVVDACSLHQIKRNQQSLLAEQGRTGLPSLLAHFLETYGHRNTESYHTAQKNFIDSCAAYSLICYFLQVKDRHNGNILIDADGHMIHIDFGFILSVSPRNLGFETSPFKLTSEMIDVMGGVDSDFFLYFKSLLLKGLITARKHHDRIMTIVEIMYKGSTLPCFRGGVAAIKAMRDRFHLTYTDEQLRYLVETLVAQSLDSLTTRLYDNFQYYTNGIL